jgi:2-iminoacetate synthase
LEQFAVNDERSPAEVVTALRREGYEPVWKDWDASYDGYRQVNREAVTAD